MTGPIIFADVYARRQLVDEGEVVTYRRSRRTTGETWWRESRTGPKRGDCVVTELGPVNPQNPAALQGHHWTAGFDSVPAWTRAIRAFYGEVPEDGYLYRVAEVTPCH